MLMRPAEYEVRAMKHLRPFRSTTHYLLAGVLLTAGVATAQNTGWRRVSDAPSSQSANPSTPVAQADPGSAQAASEAQAEPGNAQPAPAPQSEPGNAQPADPQNGGIPSRLIIEPGTLINVRTNEFLSSDRNQVGDFFSGTLTEPVVVDGIVVAQRGQTVSGRVVDVEQGGHIKGESKLGVQLTTLTAVDGQQVPVQTTFAGRAGHSNTGRSVATVGATSGVGALVGAAAEGGAGAAIGGGVGAMAGIAGVLLSHGHPAVLPSESLVTFRVQAAASVATDRAPLGFRYVDPSDYQQQQQPPQYTASAPPPPAPYYTPYPYPYYGSPYPYWGPGVSVMIGGPGFFYGPGFYGGGFYRGGIYGRRFYGRGFHR